jgi:hypothetical protein
MSADKTVTANYQPPRMAVIRAIRNVPTRVVGGHSFSAQAEISSPAPTGGLTVGLASSNSQVASLPSSTFVPAGATLSQPFTVNTSTVQASTSVTITATYQGSATATFYVDPPASVSIAWILPAEVSWGPAGTLTVAGYAQNGTGGVQMYWRDRTINGGWNAVAYTPAPDANHVWYNTIPNSNNCDTYDVHAIYSGVTSSTFTYTGVSSGYCHEAARVIWMQPQALAGFGPPGSIVLAGSATGAPSGTAIQLWYRDVTAGGGWTFGGAALPTGGIWYGAIQNASTSHVYTAYVTYDVITSATCTYAGNNGLNMCP